MRGMLALGRTTNHRMVQGDRVTRGCLEPVRPSASPTHKRRSIVRSFGRGIVACRRRVAGRGRGLESDLAMAADKERREPG
jgi:hypothetical protein